VEVTLPRPGGKERDRGDFGRDRDVLERGRRLRVVPAVEEQQGELEPELDLRDGEPLRLLVDREGVPSLVLPAELLHQANEAVRRRMGRDDESSLFSIMGRLTRDDPGCSRDR
jgi:hypothetical protein